MVNKIFLGIQGLMLSGYGLYCLISPGMLATAAGVQATSVTGTIELQSMYGGLQTAVGVMCTLALFRRSLQESAMTALLFVFAGLAVTRVTLGLSQGDFSDYTVFAMIYECLTVAFLLWRFMSSSSEIEASAGGA